MSAALESTTPLPSGPGFGRPRDRKSEVKVSRSSRRALQCVSVCVNVSECVCESARVCMYVSMSVCMCEWYVHVHVYGCV
jgi:hypothetical protein